MKIVAFSGKKQSGKTTAVDDLRLRMHGCVGVDFADALKQLLIDYFINPVSNILDRQFADINKFMDDSYKQTVHPCGKTYRELLQLIGTDWFRGIWPDVWIEIYKMKIEYEESAGEEHIITADVRFPNEVKCIQDLGGHVIRLLRVPFSEDEHESETALDRMERQMLGKSLVGFDEYKVPYCRHKFDAIIDNSKMSIAEQNEAVWKLVKEKKWI